MPTAKKPSEAARRRDERQKFLWLDQVKADHKLPHSAFLVAFELMQAFNIEYGGAAWKSIETMATDTGLSEPSIVRITRKLIERGHLRIEPGKIGRGHSNHYFRIEKTSADGGFKGSADGAFSSEKGSAGESKGSVGGGDLLKTHLTEGAEAPSEGVRESGELTLDPGAPAASGAREGEVIAPNDRFAELLAIWSVRPWGEDDDTDACLAFAVACREADPDDIIDSARRWVAAADDPRFLKPLTKWLTKGLWKKPAPQKSKRGRHDQPSAGEILLNSKYGSDRS